VGFGVDDHLIRGLMRFIKMTSKEIYDRGWYMRWRSPLIMNKDDITLRFKFFYISNLSLEKAILSRGTQ
jgi:hypothetical protein